MTSTQLKPKQELEDGTYFKAKIYAVGIRRRCRKTSNEFIKLGYFPYIEEPDEETVQTLKELAIYKLEETMRETTKAKLILSVEKISKEEGYIRNSFDLYDFRNKSYILI